MYMQLRVGVEFLFPELSVAGHSKILLKQFQEKRVLLTSICFLKVGWTQSNLKIG